MIVARNPRVSPSRSPAAKVWSVAWPLTYRTLTKARIRLERSANVISTPREPCFRKWRPPPDPKARHAVIIGAARTHLRRLQPRRRCQCLVRTRGPGASRHVGLFVDPYNNAPCSRLRSDLGPSAMAEGADE